MDLRKLYTGFIALLCCLFSSHATHLRGGVISVCKLDSRTFEITLTGYTNHGGSTLFGGGIFDLGDGTVVESDQIGREVVRSTHEVDIVELKVVHEYNSEGVYTVSYQENSRSPVQNHDHGSATDFYVATTFESLLHNCTPKVPLQKLIPVFRTGQVEVRDLMVYDGDGDQLNYFLTTPLQSPTRSVSNYRFPASSVFYSDYNRGNASRQGNPVFRINRNTGTLIWDAPGDLFPEPDDHCHQEAENCGDYTIALEVIEYREVNGVEVEISTTRADLNLTVATGLEPSPTVFTEQDNFCVGEDRAITFEVQSENPYSLKAEPSFLVENINGEAYEDLADSTFMAGSEFTVGFTDFEEGQFVTFELNGTDGETPSSFTYLLSTDCERYILGTSKPVAEEVILYPNPAGSEVWVQNVSEELKFAIMGMDGKEILQGITDNSGRIHLEEMESGLYIIRFHRKRSTDSKWQPFSSEKLVVKK